MCAGRCRRHRDLAAFHRSVSPGQTTAGEHRNADVVGRHVSRDTNVVAMCADVGDRNHSDAKGQIEIFRHPGRRLGERLPGEGSIGRWHCKARAVAAEDKREIAVFQRVGDRSDHRRACHVDGLVAVLANGLGRLLDVSDTDHPIVGHWREASFVRDVGEVAKDRQKFVKFGGGFGCVHAGFRGTIFTKSISPLLVLATMKACRAVSIIG